jgi:hypothetical protein
MKTFLAILTVALTMTALTPSVEARDHYRHHRHHTGFSLSIRPSFYGGYYPRYSYYRRPAYYYSSPVYYSSVPAYTSYYDTPRYSYYRRPIYYSRPVVRYYRPHCW